MIDKVENLLRPYKFKSMYNLELRRTIYLNLMNTQNKVLNINRDNYATLLLEPSVGFVKATGLDTSKKLYKTLVIQRQLTLANLNMHIKKSIGLGSSKEGLFLFSNKKLLTGEMTVGDLYNTCEDPEDGFIYVQYGISDSF